MAILEYLKRVFPGTAEEFAGKAQQAMLSGEKLFIVTANPEIIMHAEKEKNFGSCCFPSRQPVRRTASVW